jgi:hypothetical protein
VFTSRNVLNRDVRVVRVVRDADSDWQGSTRHLAERAAAWSFALSALLDLHPDVAEAVALLDARGHGWQAARASHAEWKLSPFD